LGRRQLRWRIRDDHRRVDEVRRHRGRVVIAAKGGQHPEHPGLGPADNRDRGRGSLPRLGPDQGDGYHAHRGDDEVDQVAVAETFDALVRSGKVSYLGASNFSLERLQNARKISTKFSLACYRVVQDRFNLVSRAAVDAQKQAYLRSEGMAELPFYS